MAYVKYGILGDDTNFDCWLEKLIKLINSRMKSIGYLPAVSDTAKDGQYKITLITIDEDNNNFITKMRFEFRLKKIGDYEKVRSALSVILFDWEDFGNKYPDNVILRGSKILSATFTNPECFSVVFDVDYYLTRRD